MEQNELGQLGRIKILQTLTYPGRCYSLSKLDKERIEFLTDDQKGNLRKYWKVKIKPKSLIFSVYIQSILGEEHFLLA